MLSPETVADLDPGIRRTVALLDAAGFTTFDSGDGRTKDAGTCVNTFPHVFARCERSILIGEADRLLLLIRSWGLTVGQATALDDATTITVEASYAPVTGLGVLMVTGLHDVFLPEEC